MAFLEIVIGSFIGTIIMSIFSYFMSDLLSEELGEPALLNKLIENVRGSSITKIIGWVVHWLFGVLFSIFSYLIFITIVNLPLWCTSILTGAISGIIGIIGWLIMLYLHPCPPKINLPLFFKQLFFAHILFALSAFLSFHIF